MKAFKYICIVALVLMGLVSCKEEPQEVFASSVVLDQTSVELLVGQTTHISASVLPKNTTDKTIKWSSSDESVASVREGTITALKIGRATITAVCGNTSASCVVNVIPTVVEEITLDLKEASLRVGETVTLTATVKPDDATDKTITWSTSDESVAVVKDGVVTAIQLGSAKITAKAGDKTAVCDVTVVATEVTSVTLDKTTASLRAGEAVTLTATVKPDDATDKTVTWTSSDESVATVSEGVVVAIKVGAATITAKAGDKTATCAVTVVATEVTSVTLDKTSATLKAGETVTLTATVNPDDATDKTVTWTSSDESVATVSEGVVVAVKVGTATITAKAGGKTATCAITVVATQVTSVTLDKTSATLKAGETVTLSATVKPDDATDKTVTWSTSDASVATVTNGVVSAVKVGTATITAKAGGKTATCAITVVATQVTSVTLDKTSATLKAGETVTLTATVNPSDATDKAVTGSTSDASVATVTNGVVVAIKVGTTTITAKAGGKTATCAITVVATQVTSVTLDKTSATLKAGETVTLTATVKPDDATDKTVTWSTSDASVATVSNGVVSAVKVGTATITAKAGDKTATCTITVVATQVTSVSLDKTSATLKAGETVTISATVKPDDATDKTVTWSTSDASVATVSNGVVVAVKVGTATITAKAGDKTATCAITVVATPVTSVTLDKTSATLKAGETVTLTATVKPDNATDKTVTWSTSDASVATVTNGVVVANKVGTATIIAKSGDKTATCAITVVATPVTSVALNKISASLKAGETITLTATVNPSDATDKAVTWSTSDASVATVTNGVVVAIKVGTATITAKAGDKTATCAVTVIPTPVSSVSLNTTSASLQVGETVTLIATVNPEDATDKTVTWSTSDGSVATVERGVVTAVKIGTATITAKAGDKTATCAITVAPPPVVPVTSVTLDKTSASLKAGETVTLTATVNPGDATDKTVTWTSSDALVATVVDGVVTAVKVGTATITAKAGEKTATCAITVVPTAVTSVTLNKTSASLKAGEIVTLTATVNPSDATDKTVTWSTSDASVATVNNGVVTAVKVGSATITARAGEKTAACAITVVPTAVTSVTLDRTSASLKAGETVTLTATVKPDDATDKTVTWSTSDATVATVTNGVVVAVKVGSATITAKAGEKTATCAITVIPTPVSSVTLNRTSASLKAGETVTLTATVNPNDATDKTVTWSTSDASVATVTNGVVVAVKVGSATITAKAGEKTATCAITVVPTPVTSVTLDKTSASLKAGETVTLTATVNPSDATDKTVTWSTSDASVATVNNGVVTAIKVGSARITAQAGEKTATCAITVVPTPVTSITLDKTSASLKAGETVILTATVNPSDATDKTVTWSTSDASVATVTNGVVVAVKVGSATITAKAGEKTATCSITVVPTAVTSITLDKTSATLKVGGSVVLSATVNPNDATDKTVTWSSSDASVASVSNGVVTANKIGTATITAKAGDKTATCEITVEATPVTSITLDKTSASLKAGETVTLTATVNPSDATDKTVTWSSSDASVATVTNGVVVAIKVGTATITAKAGEKTATCAIAVVPTAITSVTLDRTSVSMKAGETVTLTATINPSDATDKTVTWSTSDASVATVTNGVVVAIKVGSATITAEAGNKTATCAITVVPTAVTSVSLNIPSASLKVGETVTLTATVEPDDATDKTVTWSTSDATVATVTNGIVIAKKVGTATIKAMAGAKYASCEITVIPTPVTSVTLDKTSAQLKVGETLTLNATVLPDDATDKTVIWSTSDANVATVDNGVVTAVKAGTAIIMARAGDIIASCTITVPISGGHEGIGEEEWIFPVTSVTLNKTSASMKIGETITLTATVKPDDATDKTVTWTSSDETVATVVNGVVTAKKIGTATITAKAGEKTATCKITVISAATSITLNRTTLQIAPGKTYKLIATVTPADCSEPVVWTTTNSSVATVSENGEIMATTLGSAVIKATVGHLSASCTVTVTTNTIGDWGEGDHSEGNI